MPDVQEVFRMSTQKVKPDPGALERQFGQQRRRTVRRKAGVYGLVAALVVIAAVAVREGVVSARHAPAGQPSHQTTVPGAAPVGTVTFDGSKCWFQRATVDPIQSGVVLFEAVNSSGQRAMFDSWTLSKGYTFREFDATIRHDASQAEHGKTAPSFPGEKQVTYLQSDVVPANSSETIVTTMGEGRHAIACLQPYDGGPRERFRPTGLAGPIHVR
jgi:hypothetical protein